MKLTRKDEKLKVPQDFAVYRPQDTQHLSFKKRWLQCNEVALTLVTLFVPIDAPKPHTPGKNLVEKHVFALHTGYKDLRFSDL